MRCLGMEGSLRRSPVMGAVPEAESGADAVSEDDAVSEAESGADMTSDLGSPQAQTETQPHAGRG